MITHLTFDFWDGGISAKLRDRASNAQDRWSRFPAMALWSMRMLEAVIKETDEGQGMSWKLYANNDLDVRLGDRADAWGVSVQKGKEENWKTLLNKINKKHGVQWVLQSNANV